MNKLLLAITLSLSCCIVGVTPVVNAAVVFGPDAETQGAQLDVIVAVVNDDIITAGNWTKPSLLSSSASAKKERHCRRGKN